MNDTPFIITTEFLCEFEGYFFYVDPDHRFDLVGVVPPSGELFTLSWTDGRYASIYGVVPPGALEFLQRMLALIQ